MKQGIKRRLLYGLGLVLLSLSHTAKADVLLLVHGFQSDAWTWERAGIMTVLEQNGWQKTDYLGFTRQGIISRHTPEKIGEHKIASLQLPSDIQLRVQADMVTVALHYLAEKYPDDAVIMVGHSLGGLTARLSLVKNGAFQVKALITIASPHLGTDLATLGLHELGTNFFTRTFKRMFGGGKYQLLERSAPVIYDIQPEHPGNMLYALNHQPHPKIRYFSVVRSFNDGRLGDVVVPGYSQDMRSVAAIRRASTRIVQGHQHELRKQDAYTILNILKDI